jgi:hypothetical protein
MNIYINTIESSKMATNNNQQPLNIFKKNRLAVELLIKDTIEYTVDTFKQGRTNFTVASAYGQIIFVTQNIAQLILYYIEDSITELNIRTATRSNSVYGLAALAGHQSTRAIGATGEISLIAKNPGSQDLPGGVVVIPNYTKIKCKNNGQEYILDLPSDDVRVSADGKNNGITLKIVQGQIESQTFTGRGESLQSVSAGVQQTAQVDNFFVHVYVNGEKWQKYESIYDIPRNGKGFIIRNGIISGIDVIFGNTNFGMPPALGSEIRVEYLINSGDSGNLTLTDDEEASYEWSETGFTMFGDDVDLNETFVIKNVNPPDFGSNPEPLSLTRLIAPKASRSFVLANPDNYIIFLEKFNLFSIIDAFSTPGDNNVEDDNVIYLFLVPDVRKRMKSNENYFSLEEARFLLTTTQKNKVLDLIERSGSKIVTTVVSIIDPNISRYIINISLITFQGFSEDHIRQEVLQRLSDYFIQIRRRDRIPRSDMIAILEGIEGIDSVNMSIVSERDELEQIKWQSTIASIRTTNATALIPQPTPTALDEFGDIIIKPRDLPLIKGGWNDRRGIEYEVGINEEKPSAVNIIIKDTVPRTYNTSYNDNTKTDLRG